MGFGITNPLGQRAVRAPINPLDKATVVSIYPREILERKVTIQPGIFHIKPGTFENPAILVVGSSSWWKEVGEDQPLLEIPNGAITVAESIVKDYSNGLLGCNMNDRTPGLFYVPGENTVKDIKTKYTGLLDKYNTLQNNWYRELIKMADVLWARTNGNPLTISDDMRLAARELGLKDKEWIRDFTTMEMIKCKACGQPNRDTVIVCPNCKVIIDAVKFKELGLSFAS